MPSFARRFRRTAGVIVVLAAATFVALVVTGVLLVTASDPTGAIIAWVVAVALLVMSVVSAVISLLRVSALRQVIQANPHGTVFLARRQPSVVSDLASWLDDAEILDEVSDKWLVASIDERGMGAWSIGAHSRELLLVPWAEIGTVELARLESGRAGVAVDVKPFATPLLVSVGYSAYGIMASFSRRGVLEVIATANALRPAPPD